MYLDTIKNELAELQFDLKKKLQKAGKYLYLGRV